jgi:hypothetical protein
MQNCGRRPLNNGLSDLETFNLSKMGRACPRMSPRSSEFESYRKRHYQTRGPKKRGTKFELKSLTLPFTELTGPLRILGLAAVRPVRPAVRASRSISRSPDGRNAGPCCLSTRTGQWLLHFLRPVRKRSALCIIVGLAGPEDQPPPLSNTCSCQVDRPCRHKPR